MSVSSPVPIVPSSPTSRYTGPHDFLGQASVFSEYLVLMGNAIFARTQRRSRSPMVPKVKSRKSFRVRVAIDAPKNSYATCFSRGYRRLRLHRRFPTAHSSSLSRGRDREPFRTRLRTISRPVVLLLGALFPAGKVLSRATVARICTSLFAIRGAFASIV